MRSARRSLSLLVLVGALVMGVGPAPAWAAPANDTFAGAEEVVLPAVIGPVDTTGATTDAADAEAATACGFPGYVASSTVWYRFTPAEDTVLRIDSYESSYPVVTAVLTGAPGSFVAVACGSSTVALEGGTTYAMLVADSSAGGGGDLVLGLRTGEAPELTIAVAGATVAKKTGVATVTGTATCTAGAFGYLEGTLSQRVGRVATISGYGFTTLVCDGTPHTWSATFTPYSGKFAGGKAELSFYASVWNDFGTDVEQRTVTVKLNAGK